MLSYLSLLFSHLLFPNLFVSLLCLHALHYKVLTYVILKGPRPTIIDIKGGDSSPLLSAGGTTSGKTTTWSVVSSSGVLNIRLGHSGASSVKSH